MATIRQILAPHVEGGLPWPDFARFAGVPEGTVKKWGDGSRGIGEANARQLATRLGDAGYPCSWEWIRHGTPPAPSWAGTTLGIDDEPRSSGKGTPTLIREEPRAGENQDRGYKMKPGFVPASVLAELERMPEEMQRAAIAAAFARGLDHEELHGSGLLRAAMGVCRELRRLGFVGVAKEIESEMMQAVFAEIEKRSPPEPPKLTTG